MSKLNKILTNMPQALTPEEVANLSQTMSAVKTGGGNLHGADGIYATFDTESNRYDIGISGGYNGDLNVNSAEWAQKAKWSGYEYDIAEELHSQSESFLQMGNWLQNIFGTSASTWDLASAVPNLLDEVEVSPAGLLSGDGTTSSPLGVEGPAVEAISAMADPYQINGANHIYVSPESATKQVVVGLDNAANNAIDYMSEHYQYWDEASGVSGKSYVTIDQNQVIQTDNNGTTSAVSAVQYVPNTGFGTAPKQLFVCRDDNDLIANLGICQGKGTLFFECSAI